MLLMCDYRDDPKLQQLVTLFLDWNSKLNLSAIRDEDGVWEKHIADSLLITECVDLADQKLRVLDIGTGGGFPSLPLACLFPSLKFTSVDSVGKKLKAVQAMADELEVKLRTQHGRIEELGQDNAYRQQFDLVLARALAPWPVLLEYALPFVKVGGRFIAYQGPGVREDLETFKNLEKKIGGQIVKIHETKLGDSERIFVEIKKVTQTSKKYPRANGIPRKQPLSS